MDIFIPQQFQMFPSFPIFQMSFNINSSDEQLIRAFVPEAPITQPNLEINVHPDLLEGFGLNVGTTMQMLADRIREHVENLEEVSMVAQLPAANPSD